MFAIVDKKSQRFSVFDIYASTKEVILDSSEEWWEVKIVPIKPLH